MELKTIVVFMRKKQVKIRLLSLHIVKNFLVLLLKIAYADNRPTQ